MGCHHLNFDRVLELSLVLGLQEGGFPKLFETLKLQDTASLGIVLLVIDRKRRLWMGCSENDMDSWSFLYLH
jgi:hypothetical protein